jgi:hypothetical protein
VRDGARDMVRRYIDLLLIFTMCDTDQARVVGIVWQALAIANERVDQRAERRPTARSFARRWSVAS